MIELSVVIPVYKCQKSLSLLYERLKHVLTQITANHEIIFVEDGGADGSWEILSQLALRDHLVKSLQLSRNFGQHKAITAGLAESTGKWTVVMDCDLQDPPEELPRLYETAQKGFDIVLAKRKLRQHSFFRKAASKIYINLINFFNKSQIDGEYGSFSIISRKVVNSYLQIHDLDRHYLHILYWLGFKSTSIEYQHLPRVEGSSSYSFVKLIKHALDGIFFQTTILLRWIIYVGFFVSLLGLVFAVYILCQYFFHSIMPGWTSLVVVLLLLGGFIITSTGISGLYIGRIFQQVKNRPLYVVSKKVINGREDK